MSIFTAGGNYRQLPIPKGRGVTPFRGSKQYVWFDNAERKEVLYGHYFDSERGYRAYFKFKDSPASNTWAGDSLLSWANGIEASTQELRDLQATCVTLAHQIISLNDEWQRQHKPRRGIVERPGGHA